MRIYRCNQCGSESVLVKCEDLGHRKTIDLVPEKWKLLQWAQDQFFAWHEKHRLHNPIAMVPFSVPPAKLATTLLAYLGPLPRL